ncbi:hypothetical protein J2W34_000045 [Variovorax boronicumulans]|uniref:hypothetical protein n=1 Tax=Variovorax boronicumulans TaxID=436515 RepID=UPI002781B740|nr:hypothetical protein [Variovorax boronicumulans]MDQ0068271.1 hypothetical protein [Variovorax boronicumulans]
MKQEQFERLQALHEKLVDVFLDEADPEKWPGQGIALATMDAQTRGDRYWSKKNAVATIALTQRIQTLVTVVRGSGDAPPESPTSLTDPEDDLDKMTSEMEAEAKRLLNKLHSANAKAAFDRKVHGKP